MSGYSAMQRASSQSFIHQFEVRAGTSGWKYARQVEDHARRLYNAGLGEILKRIKALKTSNAWQDARKLAGQEKTKTFEKLQKDAQISLRWVELYLKDVRNKNADFQRFVGSHVTQKLAERIWKAAEKYLFAKAKRLRFKRKGEPFSFEGKNNATFLRFLKEDIKEGDIKEEDQKAYVLLGEQRFALVYSKTDPYDQHALQSRVKYVRWLRKKLHGRDRFFVQVVLEGRPFVDEKKQHKALGRLKERLKESPLRSEAPWQGVVGLDFGPRKVAISTASQGFECDLAQGLQNHQKCIRTLQRQLDRQRRAANPDRFDDAGRCIKVTTGRRSWNKSKNQRRNEQKLTEIQRKETATRRTKHGALANEVLQLGQIIKTENISFRALQKRYGKSVGKCAPSAFLGELTRKAEQARGWCERINTFQTCLSQMCVCDGRQKKPLSQRAHRCERCGFGQDVKVDRDLFSAYLAVFTNNKQKKTKTGQPEQWESSVNVEQARDQIMGHRTLSQAAQSAATLKVQSAGISSAGAHAGALEDSAKSCSNDALDPPRKRATRDTSRIPHLKTSQV